MEILYVKKWSAIREVSDHPEGFRWEVLNKAKLHPGWSIDLPDGDDRCTTKLSKTSYKLIPGRLFNLSNWYHCRFAYFSVKKCTYSSYLSISGNWHFSRREYLFVALGWNAVSTQGKYNKPEYLPVPNTGSAGVRDGRVNINYKTPGSRSAPTWGYK